LNNRWNHFIYKCWSPIYDYFFESGKFRKARETIFKDIHLEKGSKVLFVGVGTGADLPYFLNKKYEITAIDYSNEMLQVAKSKYNDNSLTFMVMDAQNMNFPNESIDFVVASLILSVVADPQRTMMEMSRVLKKDARFLIFDKFEKRDSNFLLQRILRPVIKIMGTDIGLDFYDIFTEVEDHCIVIEDKNIMMGGVYRKIMGMKKEDKK